MRTLARRRGILACLCIFQNGCGVIEEISGVLTSVHTVEGVVIVVAVAWSENLWVVLHGVSPSPVPGIIGTGNRD
jgi:ketopantoate reductase